MKGFTSAVVHEKEKHGVVGLPLVYVGKEKERTQRESYGTIKGTYIEDDHKSKPTGCGS